MNEIIFKYWLQGYVEICGDLPSKEQWEMIREHAELAEKNSGATRATEITDHPSVRVKGNFQAGKFVSIPSDAEQIHTDDFKTPFNIDPSKIVISC